MESSVNPQVFRFRQLFIRTAAKQKLTALQACLDTVLWYKIFGRLNTLFEPTNVLCVCVRARGIETSWASNIPSTMPRMPAYLPQRVWYKEIQMFGGKTKTGFRVTRSPAVSNLQEIVPQSWRSTHVDQRSPRRPSLELFGFAPPVGGVAWPNPAVKQQDRTCVCVCVCVQ